MASSVRTSVSTCPDLDEFSVATVGNESSYIEKTSILRSLLNRLKEIPKRIGFQKASLREQKIYEIDELLTEYTKDFKRLECCYSSDLKAKLKTSLLCLKGFANALKDSNVITSDYADQALHKIGVLILNLEVDIRELS